MNTATKTICLLVKLALAIVLLPIAVFVLLYTSHKLEKLYEAGYHWMNKEELHRRMDDIAKTQDFDTYMGDQYVSIIRYAGKSRVAVLVYKGFSGYSEVTFVFDDGSLKRYKRENYVSIPEGQGYLRRLMKYSDEDSALKINGEGPFRVVNTNKSPEFMKLQDEAYLSFRKSLDETMKNNGFEKVK